MIYKYLRYSTGKQDEKQQENTIDLYLKNKNLTADKKLIEQVSGKVSYQKRQIQFILSTMEKGDTLVVSEVSRLSRSISDLNKLINDVFKPKGLYLVICNLCLEINCCEISTITENLLNNLAFASQLEREFIQGRTQSAKDVQAKEIKENGFFISKDGKKIDKQGRPRGSKESPEAKLRRQENKIFKPKPEPTEREEELLRQIRLGKTNNVSYKETAENLNELFSNKEREEYFRELNEKRVKRGKPTSILFDKPILANLWQKYNSEI